MAIKVFLETLKPFQFVLVHLVFKLASLGDIRVHNMQGAESCIAEPGVIGLTAVIKPETDFVGFFA